MKLHKKTVNLSENSNSLDCNILNQSNTIFKILKTTKNIVIHDKKYIDYMNTSGCIKLPELMTTTIKKDISKNFTTLNKYDTVSSNDRVFST